MFTGQVSCIQAACREEHRQVAMPCQTGHGAGCVACLLHCRRACSCYHSPACAMQCYHASINLLPCCAPLQTLPCLTHPWVIVRICTSGVPCSIHIFPLSHAFASCLRRGSLNNADQAQAQEESSCKGPLGPCHHLASRRSSAL